MFDIVCAGILVSDTFCAPVDRLPDEGELLQVGPFAHLTGGCAANTAICLAKLGTPCRVAGEVGADAAGTGIISDLAGQGIDVSGIGRADDYPTSQTVIILCKNQDRRFLHNFGANVGFTVAELAAALDPLPGVIYLGGYLAMPGLDPDELLCLLRDLRAGGTTTILDVVMPGDMRDPPALWKVLGEVDVFLPNDDEAGQCTGLDDPLAQGAMLCEKGAGTVVVTGGDRGAVVTSRDGRWRVGAVPVECVDPSGGGDAFAAGFIKGLELGWPVTECARLGAVVGASCVRAVGCHDGVMDWAQTLSAFEGRKPSLEKA